MTDNDQNYRFKLIDFFIQRLDHTLNHNQTVTRLVYLIDSAILGAIYFGFDKFTMIPYMLFAASALTFLLFIITYLLANFLYIQNTWYRTIDQEIRNVFLGLPGFDKIWSRDLKKAQEEVLGEKHNILYRFFFINKASYCQVLIHLIIAFSLLLCSIIIFIIGLRFSGFCVCL